MLQVEARPYQDECLKAIENAELHGCRRVAVQLPTGSGKTFLFSRYAQMRNNRTIIIAHRDELIEQAVDKIKAVWPDVDVGVVKAERNELDHQVIVASQQTICNANRLRQLPNDVDLIITDEAHHAAAPTYLEIYDHFNAGDNDGPMHLGVTATLNRTDGKGLGKVYDEIVYEKNILELITEGYLCDLKCREIKTGVDISSARGYRDYKERAMTELINTDNCNKLIVDTWLEHAAKRVTIGFCVSVPHALALASQFKGAGVKSEAVHCKMHIDDRRKILKDYAKGEIDVITNYGILTEGYDNPRTDCIIVARPTKSDLLYTQMVGRGTRVHPEKKDCLILDVACISSKRDILALPDLFGLERAPVEEETIVEAVENEQEEREQRARRTVGTGKGRVARKVDVFASSRLSWIKISDGYLLNIGKEGSLRIGFDKESDNPDAYHVYWEKGKNGTEKLTDKSMTLSWAMGIGESHARRVTNGNLGLADKNARWRYQKATDGQIKILDRYNVDYDIETLTKGDASNIITMLFEENKATQKQINALKKFRVDFNEETVSKQQASMMLKECFERIDQQKTAKAS